MAKQNVMDRKEFFKTAFKKKASTITVEKYLWSPPVTGLNNYSGSWTANEVTHLLKRTMFGAKKEDVDYFLTKTLNETIDELLGTITTVTPPVRDYGLIEDTAGVFYDDRGVALGATWVNDPNALSVTQVKPSINVLRTEALQKWWTGLII